MDELNSLLSFAWQGSKKNRWTSDKWSDDKNCRPLETSRARANALLTGKRQLDPTGRWKLIAVDLDNKDNWNEVIDKFKSLDLPPSLTVQTPSGGYHIFYWIPKDVPAQNINDDRHCKNFELKGDMSNITAPGSVFDDGSLYLIVRDVPIVKLKNGQAYRLCKHRQERRPPRLPDDFKPDEMDIERVAKSYDERARHTPRGWYFRCPFHEDRKSSAVLFNTGWFFCSGCGKKELMVKKETNK